MEIHRKKVLLTLAFCSAMVSASHYRFSNAYNLRAQELRPKVDSQLAQLANSDPDIVPSSACPPLKDDKINLVYRNKCFSLNKNKEGEELFNIWKEHEIARLSSQIYEGFGEAFIYASSLAALLAFSRKSDYTFFPKKKNTPVQ